MAKTAIQNIKILHKRYNLATWTSGTVNNGGVPTLAQGEIGFCTDTHEVRIGTHDSREQTWAEAKPITAKVAQATTYYYKDGTSGADPKTNEIYVCTDASLESVDSAEGVAHKLVVEYKEITTIVPDITVVPGQSAVNSSDEIDVLTSITASKHQITETKGAAVKKAYVDSRTLTATKDGNGQFITGIKSVTNTNGEHAIVFETGDVIIDYPELIISDETVTDGSYIAGISEATDANGDHKIIVTKKTLPTLDGGKAAASDASVASGVTVEGHTVSVATKTITSGDDVISIEGGLNNITVKADTYTKAQIDALHAQVDAAIDELGKSMEFVGTLASDGSGTITSLPTPTKANIGNVYKVSVSGTYSGKVCNVGDMFICDNNLVWRYVPSGDDIEDTWRIIQVNGNNIVQTDKFNIEAGLPNTSTEDTGIVVASVREGDTTTAVITHADTSNVGDLTKQHRQYVDSLTFDDYGHVTGYTVGTESVVDTNTAHTHSAGTLIDVTGNGGIDGDVSYSHATIAAPTVTADTSKNVSVMPGGATSTFTVVDSVGTDGYGHINSVKTKDVTIQVPVDQNTTYDLSVDTTTADATIHLKGNDTTDDQIVIKGAGATTVSVEGNVITVTSKDDNTEYDLATTSEAGLVKVANVLTTTASTNVNDAIIQKYSGNNSNKLYGVNRREDGVMFVEVPWADTTEHASLTAAGVATTEVNLYAFATDKFGHARDLVEVVTIDGNYA